MRTRAASVGLTSVVGLAALGGCAAIQPRAGFEDVSRLVAERTRATLAWRDEAAAAGLRRAIDAILAKPLTADGAVQTALLNNRGLQAVYRKLGIAQADLVEAGLLPNPVLDGEVRFGTTGTAAEVAIFQNFLSIIQIPLRKRVAAAAFEHAKLEVAQAAWELATRTRTAFYRLQGAEQMLDLRRTVARATQFSAEVASRQHEAGNITDLDLATERALAVQTNLELARADAEALAEREELNEQMGLWGEDVEWTLAGRLPALPQEELAPGGLESLAVRQRLDLARLRQETEVLIRTHGLTRLYGLISDGTAHVHAEREPGGNWTTGPGIEIPLPIFDRRQAALARAVAQVEGSRERYAALATEIRAEVRRARTRMLAARAWAEYYERELLPLRERILQETQLHYNAMQLGVVQLILAKREQVEAGRAYIEALRDYWVGRTELEHAVGGELAVSGTPPAPAVPPAEALVGAPAEQPQHHH